MGLPANIESGVTIETAQGDSVEVCELTVTDERQATFAREPLLGANSDRAASMM